MAGFIMAPSATYDVKNLNHVEKHHTSDDSGSELNGVQEVQLDPVKEKKLLAKLDLAFIPVIMLVYLSCFLDRSNIGSLDPIHLQFLMLIISQAM
jgi:hypothetical protein